MKGMAEFLKTSSMLQRIVDSGELPPAYECVAKMAIFDLDHCPVCAARRKKETARKNRWREKQRSKG